MKECVKCGVDLKGDFHEKNSWADKCYNCYIGRGNQKEKIKKLLKKYPSNPKLKVGREMVTNKKRKWTGFRYD